MGDEDDSEDDSEDDIDEESLDGEIICNLLIEGV